MTPVAKLSLKFCTMLSAVAVPRAMPSTKRKFPYSHEKPVRAYPLNSFSLNIGQQDAHFYAQSGKMTLKVGTSVIALGDLQERISTMSSGPAATNTE